MTSLVRTSCFIAVAAIVCLSGVTHADVLITHTGSADPETEGWNTLGPGGLGTPLVPDTFGAVTNDQGSGIDAWFVDDDSTSGSPGAYVYELDGTELSDALAQGWTLTVNIRVVDVSAQDSAVSVRVETGSTRFSLVFGIDAGQLSVQLPIAIDGSLFDGPVVNVPGSGYHEYRLVYDPDTATADLFVDGVLEESGYAGLPLSNPEWVAWGPGSTPETGQGNWNEVTFEVHEAVPVESAWVVAGLFAGLLLALAFVCQIKTEQWT